MSVGVIIIDWLIEACEQSCSASLGKARSGDYCSVGKQPITSHVTCLHISRKQQDKKGIRGVVIIISFVSHYETFMVLLSFISLL